ncbi:MAG: hypothetical protein C0465_25185 [Ralstonia sp.]|nr:hypothetical protein [Ralstonia sp.]
MLGAHKDVAMDGTRDRNIFGAFALMIGDDIVRASSSRAPATLLLVAAVRRVRKPGAKFDYLPVLEGPQGGGKSSLVSILAGEWGGESLSLAATDKETIEQTRGQWIIEVPELSGLSTPRGLEHVKALVSRCVDRARPAYGRITETVQRQWVPVATTNESNYLSDPTGNRRFLPIPISQVDFAALRKNRDQLFAEAAMLERNYGPLVLPVARLKELAAMQGSREAPDAVQELLETRFSDRTGFVPSKDVWRVVGYNDGHLPRGRDSKHIAAQMVRLGYQGGVRRRMPDGLKVSGFQRWSDPSRPAPLISINYTTGIPVGELLNYSDAVAAGDLLN